MLKTNEFCQSMPKKFSWAILPVWLLVTTGGDSIGQVEQRGLSKWGGAGIFSRLVFYLDLLLTHPAAGGITVGRGCPANQREGTNNHV
jgi:hypothetical protein